MIHEKGHMVMHLMLIEQLTDSGTINSIVPIVLKMCLVIVWSIYSYLHLHRKVKVFSSIWHSIENLQNFEFKNPLDKGSKKKVKNWIESIKHKP